MTRADGGDIRGMGRRTTTGSTLAVLLAGGALGLAATPASAATCSRLPDIGPTGMDPADAIGIRTTGGVGCTKARSIIRKYVPRSVRSSGGSVRVGAFTCRERFASSGRISVRCTASSARSVSWKFG